MFGVAVCGKQGSGKSAVVLELARLAERNGFEPVRISFAAPLKVAVSSVLKCEGIDSCADNGWKYRHRYSLQAAGTAVRKYFVDAWCSISVSIIKEIAASKPKSFFLVDDCRYENEVEALVRLGFFVVRLEASEELRKTRVHEIVGPKHASETDLDGKPGLFHHIIDEDKSPGSPTQYADEIMEMGFFPNIKEYERASGYS